MRTENGVKEITQHNAGGNSGPTGKTAEQIDAALFDGENGDDGVVDIFVQDANNQLTGPYATPFHLEVTDFEIVDSNEDGILEFGEDITIRNIRIRNSGTIRIQDFSDSRWNTFS